LTVVLPLSVVHLEGSLASAKRKQIREKKSTSRLKTVLLSRNMVQVE
jgi:hypothetical protein